MSYYILPKNINIIDVNPIISPHECKPYLSNSFLNYYLEIKKQVNEMFALSVDTSDNTFDDAVKLINPYEFIFSKVPGSNFSVSKLKPKTNLFYDLFEILNNIDLFNNFKNVSIKSLHISHNYNDLVDCFEIFREEFNDEINVLDFIDIDNNLPENYFEYIFYDTNIFNENEYFISLVKVLIIILKNQKYKGNAIIKLKETLHKPAIDFLYLLTSFYDKVYISKPNTNNITSFDKYIVCKSYRYDESDRCYLKLNIIKLVVILKKKDDKNIIDILGRDIPYYFKNKIDELNIIIGHQQIEALDQIISIFKHINKNDKIENIKKSNIQKSVSWCEKHKIPCNKFTEKINMFLPIINETM